MPPCKIVTSNLIQHAWHNRFLCRVMFKLMETMKLLLFLLAIYLDDDGNNLGKDLC